MENASMNGSSNTVSVPTSAGGSNNKRHGARTDDLGNGNRPFQQEHHTHPIAFEFDNRPSYYSVVYICRSE